MFELEKFSVSKNDEPDASLKITKKKTSSYLKIKNILFA